MEKQTYLGIKRIAAIAHVHFVNEARECQDLPIIVPPHHGQLERGGIIGVASHHRLV